MSLDQPKDKTDLPWRVVRISAGAGPARPGRPDGTGRLEIHWDGDRPIAGFIVPPAGPARPHPVRPDGAVPALRGPTDLDAGRAGLSVIIPTRDRPDDLRRCLEAFGRQTCVPDEIIVVDNASHGSATAEVARAAGALVVREERPGLDRARNSGVRAAHGEIVAFCDDDAIVEPGWTGAARAAFDDPRVHSVAGLVLPAELETEAQRRFEFDWGFGRGFDRIDFGPEFFARTQAHGCPAWQVGAGASMAFRRSVFRQVGLFDERLDAGRAGCSGDSEMWYRILAAGGVCRYEPTMVSHHRHRRTVPEFRHQIRSYMRGHVAALIAQYQRSGHSGNLRRAFVSVPLWYLRRLSRGGDDTLAIEVAGWASGLAFAVRHRRPEVPALEDIST